MVRELNEDSYLVLTRPAVAAELTALLAVADGMGGHQAGDVASGEVIRILDGLFSSSIYQEQVGYSLERDDYYVVVLKEVLEQINERLYGLAASQPELRGMGTTGSVALFVNRHLYIGHVGDSRIYRLRSGELQHLTHDHSWVAEQVEAGALNSQEAAVHPKRNLLTRSLGNGPVLRVERTVHQVQLGDVLLLCSDGLSGVVGDGEIAQALASSSAPQQACDLLVDMANQRGGPDNITVVIAQVVDGEGNDLPGGRAFGPQGKAAPAQQAEQVDTLKLARPKQQARPRAARSRARRPKAHPDRSQQLVVGVLAGVASLACAILATAILALTMPLQFTGNILQRDFSLVFVIVLLVVLFGVGTGLYLSRWMPGAGTGARQQAGNGTENQNSPGA